MAESSYIGKGTIYVGTQDGTDALVSIGNCSNLALSFEENSVELRDFTSAGGGLANSIRTISSVSAAMTLHDLTSANLAKVLRADTSAVTAGAVSDESHTGYHGGLIKLNKLPDTSTIVVTSDPAGTTYVENTDYTVTRAGVIILSTGSIGDGDPLLISYTSKAGNLVQALTQSGLEFRMVFDGLNEAQSGKPVTIEVFRLKFGPAQNIGFIGEEFAGLELTADILQDASKSGAGISQYFTVELADAA